MIACLNRLGDTLTEDQAYLRWREPSKQLNLLENLGELFGAVVSRFELSEVMRDGGLCLK
jgi:hypothetical protein